MKNMMEYKGYYAKAMYDAESNVFFGILEGITDSISFEATNTTELRAAFEEAVDDYLTLCKRHGKAPQRLFKGTFNVRISPELHRQAAFHASACDISLNQFVEKAILHEVQR